MEIKLNVKLVTIARVYVAEKKLMDVGRRS